MPEPSALSLSGERFNALYHITSPAAEVEARARDICVEQTVEFPEALITSAAIRDQIIGRLESVEEIGPERFAARISYPIEAAGRELTQLLNVLFGNISIKPRVRLVRFDLPNTLSQVYKGPRFGQAGLRDLLGVHDRPLLCTAIKPMGLSPTELAELAYQLALGGIDLIKDDHGLTDQSFCPFDERIQRCAEAVARANAETDKRCLYLPNVSAPAGEIDARARLAKDAGAGGYLFCPGLCGLDAMRRLADDDSLGLPILSHPAFQGSYCLDADSGIAHAVLYGQLNRLGGADATIFPNWGGRFSYTKAECLDLVDGATRDMGGISPILPVPAGGMRLERVSEMVDFYGRDVILLIGGDLHAQGVDLVESCRRFERLARQSSAATGGMRSMK
ncbi:ribulose 1,5-bisphosphate carboxylase large subunit [Thiorhodococcus mannitoliphagus]|uniref:Ribulose 1,5-bisphosphate carboxylase large subunit n=1 Tax=Thiorhodococcus mannitoliphagus TaxID=329406 RepID=A0A6P1DS11_9GAMM|nr:RuBisCO large subunit C-terminal-like domain-containing protein [Thiorhodococcus mannitoliphagus]NEX18782.1 ribulose 1,5-bisphosphate carboxylase large subunit [Thiorhodococcus mannitoliphagus]